MFVVLDPPNGDVVAQYLVHSIDTMDFFYEP